MRLLLAVALTLVLALPVPVAAQESVEPPAEPGPADETPAAPDGPAEPPAAPEEPTDETPAADEPTDETPAAAADLAGPDVGDAGDEPAGLDAGEQVDAEQLDGAPAAVLITLPGGQQAEVRLTATLGELALLALAFFALTWRVATWVWWILSQLI